MERRRFLATAGTLSASLAARSALGGTAMPSAVSREPHPIDAAAFHAMRRHVDTRFGRIACHERGSGPAALFLHGFPLNAFQWRGALERLSSHRRCLAPDLMGLGHTLPASGQDLSPLAQVAMIIALLDALSIDAVDVVANDSGCTIAQLLALRHAQRVRTLLLTNGDSELECPPPVLIPIIALAHEGRFVSEFLAPQLADKALARSAKGLVGLTYTYPERMTDETLDAYLAPLVASPDLTHAYTVGLEANVLSGTAAALGELDIPTRIVWGTGDNTFSLAGAEFLQRTVGRSLGMRRVEGANLFFPEEYPDLLAEEARGLWNIR